MPPNNPGRRKVLCPKCTSPLTEPQTQIYECPICNTLLLAKGYGLGQSSNNGLHASSGRDGEDILKGSKLEKAKLISTDQEQQREEDVERENSKELGEMVGTTHEPVVFDERTPTETHLPSHPHNQPVSEAKFSRQSAELINASPEGTSLPFELPAYIPPDMKSLQHGELSPSHESGHGFSDVDSVSHSESEAYLDSPLWSSENANANEALEVPPLVNSLRSNANANEALEVPPLVNSLRSSSLVNSSIEQLRAVTSLDCSERVQEESESVKDEHQSTLACKSGVIENKFPDSDFRSREMVAVEVTDISAKSVLKEEDHILEDKKYKESADDKEADSTYMGPFDHDANGTVGSKTSRTQPSSLIGKQTVTTATGDSKDSQGNGDRKQMPGVGKFRLFDLSVFGIYNEETYDVIRRGRMAGLSEEGNDSENLQGPVINEVESHHFDDAAQDPSSDVDRSEACINEKISQVEKGADMRRSSVLHTEGNCSGTGDDHELHKNASQEDTDMRSVGSLKAEAEICNGTGSEDVLLRDNDALAEARYGDIPSVAELNLEPSHVDMSFGDWQLLQAPRPSQTVFADEKRTTNSATDGDADSSSWDDDDEELTFSSSAKGTLEPKGSDLINQDVQGSPSTTEINGGSQMESNGRSQAGIFAGKPGFALRTTAMQKFLQRDDQQTAAQRKSSHSLDGADPVFYEAPYMEHCTPPLEKGRREFSDQTPAPSSREEMWNISYMKGHDPHADTLEEVEQGGMAELQSENAHSDHSLPTSNVNSSDVSLTPALLKEEDKQSAPVENGHLQEEVEFVSSSQSTSVGQKMDQKDLEVAALTSQKVDYVNRWNAPGKPTSLRWKGKGSSTQSISSTEDEGASAYGAESEAGSGPEKDLTRERLIGRHFPDKKGTFGLGQQPTGPSDRFSQRTVNRQKHSSVESATSRRTTRSRPLVGLERSGEQVPGYLGPGRGLDMGGLDQRPSNLDDGAADYNSDHSSRSQDAQPRSQYLSNPYGSALGVSSRVSSYPFQGPPHASLPVAPLQDQGFSHHTHPHHCISPACSLCIQQQHFMQQPQMLQNTMLHPCAACAAQASAAPYQPMMHYEMHGHHMHGLTHSNPLLNHDDLSVLPAQSRRQNRSSIQHNHPVSLTRRKKHYPPLPGKSAPPYVLCRDCNQMLQVPEYLPPICGSVLKLRCGACEKISKFSFTHVGNESSWPAATALPKFVAKDKYTEVLNGYASDQSLSSGVLSPPQSLHGRGRHVPGQGSDREWVDNRVASHPNVSGIPPIRPEILGSWHPIRPGAGSTGLEHGLYGRNVPSGTGLYNEDYFSSSPSRVSDTIPGRLSQRSRDNQQIGPFGMGRPASEDRKHSLDSSTLSTFHEGGRFPSGAAIFSDGLFQQGMIERTRFSGKSLEGSSHDPSSESSYNEHVESLEPPVSKAGSWHNRPADMGYTGKNFARSYAQQAQKLPVAPGSPLIEHFSQDVADTTASVQWSSRSDPRYSSSSDPHAPVSPEFSERSSESGRSRLPAQDASKGTKSIAGLLKRGIKDFGKGGQGGGNRRKVVVNGSSIPEAAVQVAEERAGPIHSGTYWYDYQAGFWGVMGGPCLGIVMPFIEEFHFPLSRSCAGGKTGILVNGRELHEKDLEVLAKRGLPTSSGKAYILDISGAVIDEISGQPLKGLGKLAPSIEKRGRGFGMSPYTAQS